MKGHRELYYAAGTNKNQHVNSDQCKCCGGSHFTGVGNGALMFIQSGELKATLLL